MGTIFDVVVELKCKLWRGNYAMSKSLGLWVSWSPSVLMIATTLIYYENQILHNQSYTTLIGYN
jgi:hypothetical protein